MPINAPPEFYKAQERYLKARSIEEKIDALEEMIAVLPKHKGTENLLAQLKAKLSKLKEQQEKQLRSKKGGVRGIRKEGDVLVAVVGLPNSGKTRFINMLCGTSFKESEIPYSTTEPLTAVCDYGGAKIQLVEIPAFFRRQDVAIAKISDCVVVVARSDEEVREVLRILEENRVRKPVISFMWNMEKEEVVKKIWELSGFIRVYTKKDMERPIIVRRGSTVRDVAEKIHEDFVKYFKFARVWGKSVKFQGEKVGLEHVLEDGDVVEIRTR